MNSITIKKAVQSGWQIFQFHFTNGSNARIASLITENDSDEVITRLIEYDFLTEHIDDEDPCFSYEEFFGREIKGLIKEITDEYR